LAAAGKKIMAQLTAQLISVALVIPLARAEKWVDSINAAATEFGIGTPAELADFLAQIGHESVGLSQTAESFNYSVDGLIATFGKRIVATAGILGRKPGEGPLSLERQSRIANIVYANRYGNGDAASGDGWLYAGGGLKQITFHDNYAACSAALGVNLLTNPKLLSTDKTLAARSAGWFWFSIGGNNYVKTGDFDGLSARVNGSGISLDSLVARRKRRVACKKALGVV
jgi:putative chitinase